MKLSAKGRYAVTAMADIAAQGQDATVSLSDIALRQGISQSFLEQLFAKLRRAGLVKSLRGPGGGYVLGRAASDILVGDIIRAVNENIKAHGCDPTKSLSCTGTTVRCLTHSLWGALESHIGDFLGTVTLDDVLTRRFHDEAAE